MKRIIKHFLIYLSSFSDGNEFAYPSISASASVANSPILIRRDSILKHSGSIKNPDRRVSIKQNQPVLVEYLSEKRQQQHERNQQPQIQLQQQTQIQTVQQIQSVQLPAQSVNARPVSLILSKGERPTFKLVRTPSIDQQEIIDESPTNTDTAITEQCNNVHINNLNSCNSLLKDDNDDDESVPLVQAVEPNKITSSNKLEKF